MKQSCTTQGAWMQLNNERMTILNRVEDYARWTLPYILPSASQTDVTNEELTVSAGSIGARCVNHLANKIVSTLFVPYRPFFRLSVSDDIVATLKESGLSEANIDLILSQAEKQGMDSVNVAEHRRIAAQAVKALIVAGTALLWYPEDGGVALYNTKDYVVKRDMGGRILRIITRDIIAWQGLDADIKEVLNKHTATKKNYQDDTSVTVYTDIRLQDGKYQVTKSVDDVLIPDSEGSYPLDKLPWIVLTWTLLRGEDYGRGLVEDFAYTFDTHSILTASERAVFALLSDLKLLVDPSSQIDVEVLNRGQSGTYLAGKQGDVTMVEYNLQLQLAALTNKIELLERELGQAFLLNSAVTRNAERVTAEEIRMQITELETSHGGIYSGLATEWQQPLVKLILDRIGFELGESIKPTIITGMETLSRAGDLQSIQLFLGDLSMTQNIPPPFQSWLNVPNFIAELGALHGINPSKFLYTPEEMQAIQQQQQQQEMQMQQMQAQQQQQLAETQALAQNL